MTEATTDINDRTNQSPGLAPEDMAEFQALLRRECNLHLDTSEAWRRATQLIDLVRMLVGPIPEDSGEKPPISSSSTPVAIDGMGCGRVI